ncbi:hypothetical protein F511_03736 [Dorcoceras hygrometricum]|uniref:CCHC-type domain-containing protein n=1 Tax=Dorcoceras hygrometricum TaxID=472368 RepID=A0A2Z7BF59_9LAMI|nr:hypothetical protein F511_03736 [Dorcoceras hygrometricum]
MISSLVSNINQVHFASVLAMDNSEMVAMFEALVASGLNGFLGCMTEISETALIEFYENASVRGDKVVSTVQGKLVEISEEVFARTFQLLMKGLIDISEVPKDLIFDAITEFSLTGEQLTTSCKKQELKIEYRLLSDIVAKSITVKAGSFDVSDNILVAEIPAATTAKEIVLAPVPDVEQLSSDEELMSIDELLKRIPGDMMLPSILAAEPTKIMFGLGISIPGVANGDLYKASLPKIALTDKGKASLVKASVVKVHPAREMVDLIFGDIEFLIQFRENVIDEVSAFYHSFSLRRLEVLQSLNKDIAAKEENVLTWAETDLCKLLSREKCIYSQSIGKCCFESFWNPIEKISVQDNLGCKGERQYRTLISLLGSLATMRRVVNYHSSWARQRQQQQPQVAQQSGRQRFRPRGQQFKKKSGSGSSGSGSSSSSGSRTEFCGFCDGKHPSIQCVGVQGSCNLCGQYGNFARVCPSAGSQQTMAQPQGRGGQSRCRSQQFQQPRLGETQFRSFQQPGPSRFGQSSQSFSSQPQHAQREEETSSFWLALRNQSMRIIDFQMPTLVNVPVARVWFSCSLRLSTRPDSYDRWVHEDETPVSQPLVQLPQRLSLESLAPICLFFPPVQCLRASTLLVNTLAWSRVCKEIFRYSMFGCLKPVGSFNVCTDIVPVGPVLRVFSIPRRVVDNVSYRIQILDSTPTDFVPSSPHQSSTSTSSMHFTDEIIQGTTTAVGSTPTVAQFSLPPTVSDSFNDLRTSMSRICWGTTITSIRSTTGYETPSSACTRRPDEISGRILLEILAGTISGERRRRRRLAAAVAALRERREAAEALRVRVFECYVMSITDSACKNQLVVVSVQYGPFNPYIPIRSTTIGKSRVAKDPIAMHTSWRSNSDHECN